MEKRALFFKEITEVDEDPIAVFEATNILLENSEVKIEKMGYNNTKLNDNKILHTMFIHYVATLSYSQCREIESEAVETLEFWIERKLKEKE